MSIFGNDGSILLNVIDAIGTVLIFAFMIWTVCLCCENDQEESSNDDAC